MFAPDSTAARVINLLESSYGFQEKNGQWKGNSPFKEGSDSRSFTVVISDDEHGAYFYFAHNDGGSLYDLAQKLGVALPAELPKTESLKRYESMADYASSHGLTAEELSSAGFVEAKDSPHYGTRPALRYPTRTGSRWRFLDGDKPKYDSPSGYQPCWYGLDQAISRAKAEQRPIFWVNGEVSVLAAHKRGIPAFALTNGEHGIAKHPELMEELKSKWQGTICICLDCDEAGRKATTIISEQLYRAGFVGVRVVDMKLMQGGDVADFCMLFHESAFTNLMQRSYIPADTSGYQLAIEFAAIGKVLSAGAKGEGKMAIHRMSKITEEMFVADPRHRSLWLAINAALEPTPMFIKVKLAEQGTLDSVSEKYVDELASSNPVESEKALQEQLIDQWERRALAQAYEDMREVVMGGELKAAARVEEMIARIRRSVSTHKHFFMSTHEAATLARAQVDSNLFSEEVVAAPMPFKALHILGGMCEVLMGGKVVAIAGSTGAGKAQPLTAKVLTPSGWRNMGDLKTGDFVIGKDGCPTKIVGIYPQGEKDIYHVTFSDDTSTECCEDHLWTVRGKGHGWKTRSLKEIRQIGLHGISGQAKHYAPYMDAVEYPYTALPVDPYLLGLLLGNACLTHGSVLFSTADAEVIESIRERLPADVRIVYTGKYDYRIARQRTPGMNTRSGNSLINSLSELGVMGKLSNAKFIPAMYLTAHKEARIALLQGLMDTDGSVSGGKSSIDYITVSKQLALDVRDLVRSLGGKAHWAEKQPTYTYNNEKRLGQPAYRLSIVLPVEVSGFRVKRKADKVKRRTKYAEMIRFIKSIEYVGKKHAQCIKVASPDGLYITDDYIVTHNTSVIETMLEPLTEQGLNVAFYNPEWAGEQSFYRRIQRHGGPPFTRIFKHIAWKSSGFGAPFTTEEEQSYLDAEALILRKKGNIYYFSEASSMHGIVSAAANLDANLRVRGTRLHVVVIDYVQRLLGVSSGEDNASSSANAVVNEFKSYIDQSKAIGFMLTQVNKEASRKFSREWNEDDPPFLDEYDFNFIRADQVNLALTINPTERGKRLHTLYVAKNSIGDAGGRKAMIPVWMDWRYLQFVDQSDPERVALLERLDRGTWN